MQDFNLAHHLVENDTNVPPGADALLVRRTTNRRKVFTYFFHNVKGEPKKLIRDDACDGKPKTVVDILRAQYHIPSKTKVDDLKQELKNFKMKPNESLVSVKKRLDGLVNKLRDQDCKIADKKKRKYLIVSLKNEEWDDHLKKEEELNQTAIKDQQERTFLQSYLFLKEEEASSKFRMQNCVVGIGGVVKEEKA